MQVTINGENHELPEPCVVSELLRRLDQLARTHIVRCRRRGKRRSQQSQHQEKQDDRIEIVTLVGGG